MLAWTHPAHGLTPKSRQWQRRGNTINNKVALSLFKDFTLPYMHGSGPSRHCEHDYMHSKTCTRSSDRARPRSMPRRLVVLLSTPTRRPPARCHLKPERPTLAAPAAASAAAAGKPLPVVLRAAFDDRRWRQESS